MYNFLRANNKSCPPWSLTVPLLVRELKCLLIGTFERFLCFKKNCSSVGILGVFKYKSLYSALKAWNIFQKRTETYFDFPVSS